MPTPIQNITTQVSAGTQRSTLQSIADQRSALLQVADKPTAINAIVDNADQTARLNFFFGIQGDGEAEDLLTSSNSLIDKVVERVPVIEELNKSESAIRKILCRREGRDPSNYADLSEVVNDQSLISDIAARSQSSKVLSRAEKAITEAVNSQTAMESLSADQTALTEFRNSQLALDKIDGVDFAVRAVMCGTTSLDPTSFNSVSDIAADGGAMGTITENEPAMATLALLPSAMDAIASESASISAFLSNSSTVEDIMSNTVLNSSVAEQELDDSPFTETFNVSNNNDLSYRGGGSLMSKRAIYVDTPSSDGGGNINTNASAEGNVMSVINDANVGSGAFQDKTIRIVS